MEVYQPLFEILSAYGPIISLVIFTHSYGTTSGSASVQFKTKDAGMNCLATKLRLFKS